MNGMGPVMESYKYVERFLQNMHLVTFTCAHGAQIENEFGYFVEIEPLNTNVSRCTIFFAPNYTEEGVPIFELQTELKKPYSDFICSASITRQIVPTGTAVETGADVWESTVTPIDNVHSMRTTVHALTLETLIHQEWDERINGYVTVSRNLQIVGVEPEVVIAEDLVTFTHSEQVKCGWFLKTMEQFAVLDRSYDTTVEFYWPAVFNNFLTNDFPKKDGSSVYMVMAVMKHEAYRGPCSATVVEKFVPTTAAIIVSTMLPLPLHLETPFVSFATEPCLHGEITYTLNISGDAIYEDVAGAYTYGATLPTDWPDDIIASEVYEPFRGGYFHRKITVKQPTYTATPP